MFRESDRGTVEKCEFMLSKLSAPRRIANQNGSKHTWWIRSTPGLSGKCALLRQYDDEYRLRRNDLPAAVTIKYDAAWRSSTGATVHRP
jgi:hypothetical protein